MVVRQCRAKSDDVARQAVWQGQLHGPVPRQAFQCRLGRGPRCERHVWPLCEHRRTVTVCCQRNTDLGFGFGFGLKFGFRARAWVRVCATYMLMMRPPLPGSRGTIALTSSRGALALICIHLRKDTSLISLRHERKRIHTRNTGVGPGFPLTGQTDPRVFHGRALARADRTRRCLPRCGRCWC